MPDRKDSADMAAKVNAALRRMKAVDPSRDGPAGGMAQRDAAAGRSGPGPSELGARLQKASGAFAALEAAVQKSRGEFVDRLARYGATLEAVDLDEDDPGQADAALEHAMRIAHRIAGVGGTYGFQDLGETAREAEHAIAAYRSSRGSGDLKAASIAQITRLTGLIDGICSDRNPCPA